MIVKLLRHMLAAPLPKSSGEVTEVVNFTSWAIQGVVVAKFETLSCVYQELMVLRPAGEAWLQQWPPARVLLAMGARGNLHYLGEIIVWRSCFTEGFPMRQGGQRWLIRKAAAFEQRCGSLWPVQHSFVEVHTAKYSPNLWPNVEPPLRVVVLPLRDVRLDLFNDLFVRSDMDCLFE